MTDNNCTHFVFDKEAKIKTPYLGDKTTAVFNNDSRKIGCPYAEE